MKDSYDSWVDRVVGGRDGKPLTAGEEVIPSAPEPFQPIQFAKVDREKYTAEVGKKGDAYIYHFFPGPDFANSNPTFYPKMAEAFAQVFKDTDRIEADWVEDLNSWAVRANGFVSHIWGDDMAIRVFSVLDELLKTKDS